MNLEELKKKIAIVAARSYDDWVEEDYAGRIQKIDFDKLADALIAAGICDITHIMSLADNVMLSVIAHKAEVSSMEQRAKDAEHRAARAERAVYNLAYGEWQREGARRAICEKYAPSTARDYLDRAEKELAEEKKNDGRT